MTATVRMTGAQISALYGLARKFPGVQLKQAGEDDAVLVGDDRGRLWSLDADGCSHRLADAPAAA